MIWKYNTGIIPRISELHLGDYIGLDEWITNNCFRPWFVESIVKEISDSLKYFLQEQLVPQTLSQIKYEILKIINKFYCMGHLKSNSINIVMAENYSSSIIILHQVRGINLYPVF